MRMIHSASNPQVQRVRKLLKKRKQQSFVIEGKKLFQEALAAHLYFEDVFVTPELWSVERERLEPLEKQGTTIFQISPGLLRSISDVKEPQGILSVVRRPLPFADLSIRKVALLLMSIRDPGNFGAILRTAEAFGCEWIGYSRDCVDPFQSKVARGSMGSLFRIPVIEIKNPAIFLADQIKRKVDVYGLLPRAKLSLTDWVPAFPLILCIGSESHGLPEDLPFTEIISIPMKGKVESLNAAVAVAVCLHLILIKHV